MPESYSKVRMLGVATGTCHAVTPKHSQKMFVVELSPIHLHRFIA